MYDNNFIYFCYTYLGLSRLITIKLMTDHAMQCAQAIIYTTLDIAVKYRLFRDPLH